MLSRPIVYRATIISYFYTNNRLQLQSLKNTKKEQLKYTKNIRNYIQTNEIMVHRPSRG